MNDLILEFDREARRILTPLIDGTVVEVIDDRQLVVKGFFDVERVPDVCRYQVTINNGEIDVVSNTKKDISESAFWDIRVQSSEQSILVVLESPHKDEFRVKNGVRTPIAPAQGATGKNFEYHFSCVLRRILDLGALLPNGSYDLILSNPVQYQASLHYVHRKGMGATIAKGIKISDVRDFVWRQLWISSQADFEDRVERYKPVLAINCCTASLKPDVSEALSNQDVQTIEAAHPSSWRQYNLQWHRIG